MSMLDEILIKLGLKKKHIDICVFLDDQNVLKNTKYDWRHSVVDLMKLLDINPTEANRFSLAQELGYTGTLGSPDMNEWLRREIMRRVADNGGEVPEELR